MSGVWPYLLVALTYVVGIPLIVKLGQYFDSL